MKTKLPFLLLSLCVFSFNSNAETVFDLNDDDGLLIQAPEDYELAEYSFGAIQRNYQYRPLAPLMGDWRGIRIKTKGTGKEGVQIFLSSVDVGEGPVLIQCSIEINRSWAEDATVGVAALNIPINDGKSSIGASLAIEKALLRDMVRKNEYIITLLYDPPQDRLIPLIQLISESEVELYIDEIVVTPIRELTPEQIVERLNLNDRS